MKQGVLALKSGECEGFFFLKNTSRNEVKVTEWAPDRKKEAFEKVAKDQKAEHRPRNHDKKYRLLATHHRVSARGKEALRCHTCAHIVTVSR